MQPEDILKQYEHNINSHDFDQLVPLISENAIFWFNDGSHVGIDAVRKAFENTWKSFPVDAYWLEDIAWVAAGETAASCTYSFRWKAVIHGRETTGGGRGTTVFQKENNSWKITHEHLSQFPI